MAVFSMTIESAGRPVPGAEVTIYNEASGRTEFTDADKTSIFTSDTMATAKSNPLIADSLGEIECYVPSMTLIAIKISRTGYGTRWLRNREVLGSDQP